MKRNRTPYDRPTFILTFLLIGFGMVMLYSASSTIAVDEFGSAGYFLKRHIVRFLVGAVFMVAFMRLNYRFLEKLSPLIYLGSILLLLATLGYSWSHHITSPARWLRLGFFNVQTADVAKFAMVVYLAAYLAHRQEGIRDLKHGLLPALIMIAICIGLIIIQPDFSTAFTIGAIAFILLYLGRAKIAHLLAVMAVFAVIGASVVYTSPYKLQRLETYLHPGADGSNTGYQIKQSLISLGNGGLLGMGLGDSYEKNLFLPEPHTDFIFAIIGEELGFIGTAGILTLFLLLYLQILRLGRSAPDLFGMYLTVGLGTAIFLYAVIHAGVVTGLLPTTGLPLPFISYGGSHLITSMASIGVILNISSYRSEDKERRAWW